MVENFEITNEAIVSTGLSLGLMGCLAVLVWERFQRQLSARPLSPYAAVRKPNDGALFVYVLALVSAGFVILITPIVFYFCVAFAGAWLMYLSLIHI